MIKPTDEMPKDKQTAKNNEDAASVQGTKFECSGIMK